MGRLTTKERLIGLLRSMLDQDQREQQPEIDPDALIGQAILFEYPACNIIGVPPRWEARRVKVLALRRLDDSPLDPVTRELNPLLNRGPVLLKCWDLDKQAERHFYLHRMAEVKPIGPAASPPPASGDYQLWIVEQADEFEDRASLAPADFYTDDLDAAKTWAETFNDGELASPVGAWAIIRRAPEMHRN